MSENTNTPPVTPDQLNPIQALFSNIRTTVDTVASIQAVLDAVANNAANEEKQKRVDLVANGLKAHRDATNALRKIKPDQEFYAEADQPGKPSIRHYTKSKVDERAKLTATLKRVEEALTLALTKSDFSKLSQIKANPAGDTPAKTDDAAAE